MELTKGSESGYFWGGMRYDDEIKKQSYSIIQENKRRDKKLVKNKRKKVVIPPSKTISENFLRKLKTHVRREKAKSRKLAFKEVRKFVYDMKKQGYKYKDMQSPDYKKFNVYRFSSFENHILPRSFESPITAKTAWICLKKCWIGFKDSYALGNDDGVKFYGRGIQKYAYLLEEVVPDMSNIGLDKYNPFISYENK